ncbi:MAG: ATP-binding protein [Ilumatobacter fluminis]|uniref:ATP-binding protein n=1 Tax=Ilumatobacter fluminis TaxID=467091 RepID=UPI0032EFD293
MTRDQTPSIDDCAVLTEVAEVARRRSLDRDAPIVAIVDGLVADEHVIAQSAGADVVLVGDTVRGDAPGLELARHAATAMAARRTRITRASRRAAHDVAQSLNLIGLTTDAAQHGRLDTEEALQRIRDIVDDAGDDVWRSGRPNRCGLVLVPVDLCALVRDRVDAPDITATVPDDDVVVLADEHALGHSVDELIANARRSGATDVRMSVWADREVATLRVTDDGSGFPDDLPTEIGRPFAAPSGSDRLGLGLALIAEQADDLGGALIVTDPGHGAAPTTVELTLPRFDRHAPDTTAGSPAAVEPSDQVGAQADILEGVVRHAPLSESLEAIVAAIERQLPGAVCSILLLHEGRFLRHGAGARLPLAYREAIDGVAIGVGQGSCGTAAYTGKPVIAADVTTDENWDDFRHIALAHGLRSCWSTPIVAAEGGDILGTFAVYKPAPWHPDEAAIRRVNRFTYLAAVAIDHHRLFAALAKSEARFRSAFEGAAAGLALTSLDGTISKSNPALSRVVGRSVAELAGTNLLDLVDVDHHAAVLESWAEQRDARTSTLRTVDVPLADSDGDAWLSLHSSLIPAESGRQPYLYVEVRDITASRRQLADLRAREVAEAANQAKTDFLALASHELRTPLNSILGFAQVMQMVDLDAGQRADSVEQIVSAGRHLRDLIDQLLDLSRIESGQLSVDAVPVDAADVVGEALELVRPLAAAREIEIVRNVDDTTPSALADQRCMRQVVINLLDNAVKYTPTGGRVDVDVSRVDDDTVRVSVADTGPGIAPDSLDDIFQPFLRLDDATVSGKKGTGLGLAVCERLMREMHGSVAVVSTLGVGSTFHADFPVASRNAVSAPHDEPESAATARQPSGRGTVLYIENDPVSVEVVRAALRLRPDLALRSAETAAAGLALLVDDTVDVVLLDIGLPDRSGWDVLGRIRAARPGLPVIVVTAGGDDGPDDARPDRRFDKPLDVRAVLGAIDAARAGTLGDDLTEPVHALDQ